MNGSSLMLRAVLIANAAIGSSFTFIPSTGRTGSTHVLNGRSALSSTKDVTELDSAATDWARKQRENLSYAPNKRTSSSADDGAAELVNIKLRKSETLSVPEDVVESNGSNTADISDAISRNKSTPGVPSAAMEWAKQQQMDMEGSSSNENEKDVSSADEDVEDNSSDDSSENSSENNSSSNESGSRDDNGSSDSSESPQSDESTTTPKKTYVIVGGGWGGWGAAKALCQQSDSNVILLDALPDPTGATPYLSSTGKPVEAGTRGFWKDYPNIYALCDELGLDQNEVFSPYTNSSFYSPDGLEATAPVFAETKVKDLLKPFQSFLPDIVNDFVKDDDLFPQLPSPFGQILATFPLFERIPLPDRASMIGLLIATIDALGSDDEDVRAAYDRMTAHELFLRFNLSARMVRDFIRPTLLVGLFKPPEELSAFVVMELLYYYALAHQDSFDVRWIKNGTVSDSLVAPLAEKLVTEEGLDVRGGCRVQEISLEATNNKLGASKISYTTYVNGQEEKCEINDVDGVVLALGCKGMKSVINTSPQLAKLPEFSKAASLNGIDVISVRLWFDKTITTRTPANVFSRFEELRGAGGTFFMLDQLQDGNEEALWGGDDVQGSVVACDFYNSGALMSLSDEDLTDVLTKVLLPSAVPQFSHATLVDSWVAKYPGTVSWFSPGSYTSRPPLEGAGNILPNVKCAGDWVRMGDREHGAKGLCQERAFVSGLEAANSLMKSTKDQGEIVELAQVLPVREDEAQFKLGVELNKAVMKNVPRFWVR